MNPSRLFILRPIATSLLMLAILLAGILAYQLLPISSLPEVEYPTIQVSTFYPGASPDVVGSVVTAPLEREFNQMPGLNQMTSSSASGASVITLQFNLNLSLDVAEQEVQAAINAVSNVLPKELPNPPIYRKVNPADPPILTLALTSTVLPLPSIEDVVETRLVPKLAQLTGVGVVSINGGQRPAVRIQANPMALSAYGLSLEDVRTTIAAANVNAAKGSFDGPRLSYIINSNDQLLTAAEYQSLIIAYKNNAPIRLADVATISSAAENSYQSAWVNTTPAVIVNIQRQPGANVIAVVDRIKQLLPKLQALLPATIQVNTLTDRTITIRASVRDVQFELLLSVALVVMVIFLFLRNVPATLIPSAAVPLSLVGTFGVMYLFGFSLNNLTLMALTIAAGFVVDDAIVMIENIARYIEEGEQPLAAALKGAKQIGFTIISLTLSLIAVLIPLLFMQDVVGRLFHEFAVTLAAAILLSAFVSLTFTPMLCAKFLRSHFDPHPNPLPSRERGFFRRNSLSRLRGRARVGVKVEKIYAKTLTWVLARQPQTLLVAMATLVLTGLLFYYIPKGFFPLQDTGVIQGISEASQSISFKEMAERQQVLARVILTDPAVANLSSFVGIDGTNTTLNSGRLLITLKLLDERDGTANEVIQRLQPKLAKVLGIKLYMQPVQDLTVDDRISRTRYQLSVSSPHTDEVAKWSARLLKAMQTSPLLQDATSDQQNLGLQTYIEFDRDTAARLGITIQMLDNILYDAFGQRQISTMFTQRNQYHVVLEAAPELQVAPTALNNLYLNSATGGSVPFSAVARFHQTVGPLVINRQNQFPASTLSFNLAPQASLDAAINAINDIKADLAPPYSVDIEFEGTAQIFQSALQNQGWLLLAAVLTVYIVLGVLYESFVHPITILSTLPSACVGALLALLLTGNSLDVISLIGIILLIGLVMKNAIMMIDFALDLERQQKQSPQEAIYQAALLRFRPILMTSMAAFFGAIPLAFGMGMGAELRQPLGIAIMGGLLVSQLLTLYTTPVIYLAFDRLKERMAAS